jgi:hypothetical protein
MKRSSPVEHLVRHCTIREEEDEILRLRQRVRQGGRVDTETNRNCVTHLPGADGQAGAADGDQQGTTQSSFSAINGL